MFPRDGPVRSCPQRLKARGLVRIGVFPSLAGGKGDEGGMIGTVMEVAKACRVLVAYPVRISKLQLLISSICTQPNVSRHWRARSVFYCNHAPSLSGPAFSGSCGQEGHTVVLSVV
jgi:hypothetical protein